MIIRLKGIKRVTRGPYTHYYHRKTMKVKGANARIFGEYGSAEFRANYDTLDSAVHNPSTAIPGSWGHLVEAYKRSPEFSGLMPRTKASYNGVFDYLKPAKNAPLSSMDPKTILKARDKAFEAKKITFANNLLAVMKLVFSWGVPRGHLEANPATDLKKIPIPKGRKKQNRAWTDSEFETFMSLAPYELKLAIGLAGYVGVRRGDLVSVPWSAYQGGRINITQNKTDVEIWVHVHKDFKAILQKAKKTATVIVTGKKGHALTPDGLSTNFDRFRNKLVKDNLIGTGLTIHGLRTTVVHKLVQAGCTDDQVKAVTGHLSDAALKTYKQGAGKKEDATAAILKWEQGSNKSGKL
ncbi:MAG: tyrosine-type recombinase/integrase [Sneathiella sp.]